MNEIVKNIFGSLNSHSKALNAHKDELGVHARFLNKQARINKHTGICFVVIVALLYHTYSTEKKMEERINKLESKISGVGAEERDFDG